MSDKNILERIQVLRAFAAAGPLGILGGQLIGNQLVQIMNDYEPDTPEGMAAFELFQEIADLPKPPPVGPEERNAVKDKQDAWLNPHVKRYHDGKPS